jgi:D-cysteine desulfhydrase family pyridoxal phosphate-dependent enzyme
MKIPLRIPLAYLPTSIEPLPRLTAALAGPELLIKRDDQTGLAFGGNKTRKLEFLMADAQAKGAHTVITGGAAQSNHCRQTAAAAARLGMGCILILAGDPPPTSSGNLLLDLLLNAEIVWSGAKPRDQVLRETYEDARASGRFPYLVPYGGSNAIGAAAYAFAVQELLEQGCKPDWIVFPSSSGGTQAGLVAGARLFEFKGRILGISVDKQALDLQDGVAQLATETAAWLDFPVKFSPGEILVNAEYLGGGYGVMGNPECEAIKLFAQAEGIFLDPVYTGRAAAGLIDLIRKGFFDPGQKVLFWHTGGAPALFADKYAVILTR